MIVDEPRQVPELGRREIAVGEQQIETQLEALMADLAHWEDQDRPVAG